MSLQRQAREPQPPPTPEDTPIPSELDQAPAESPLAPPLTPRERKIVTVPLFESGHEGYGDATQVKDHRYNRVHGSMDMRWPGEMRMGRGITKVASGNWDYTPVAAFEWVDNDYIQPVIYIVVQDEIHALQWGSLTQVGTNILTTNATTAAFHDDASGVAYLYVGRGGHSTEGTIAALPLTDTEDLPNAALRASEPTGIRAQILLSTGGDLYRTYAPVAGALTPTCYISKCPYGSDPFTVAPWQTGVLVGRPSTSINALVEVQGQYPVAIKPEGIFMYVRAIDKWVNFMRSWEHFHHNDNGKGAFSLGEQVVVPQGDGGAVIFDGWTARPFDPIDLEATPNLHTTPGTFNVPSDTGGTGSLAALRQWIVGAVPSTAKMISAGDDLHFLFYDASGPTYTDFSAEVRDGNLDTDATFTIGQTTDRLYIGWHRPFVGIHFATGSTADVNATSSTMTVKVHNGTSWATVSSRDFTALAGAALGRNRLNIMMTEDPVSQDAWVKSNINSGDTVQDNPLLVGATTLNVSDGPTFSVNDIITIGTERCLVTAIVTNALTIVRGYDGTTAAQHAQNAAISIYAYWVELSFSATLDAVNWANCRILPWYPSVDSTNYPLDGLDRAGSFPHILMGRYRPGEGGVWHDMGSLSEPDEIGAVLQANVGGTSLNQFRNLLLIGRYGIWRVDSSPDDHPESESHPFLNSVGLAEGSSIKPADWLKDDQASPMNTVARLLRIRIDGHEFDPSLMGRFYYTWDYGKPWSRGLQMSSAPGDYAVHESGVGRTFRYAFGWTQSSTGPQATAPVATRIEADFEIIESRLDSTQERSLQDTVRF